MYVCSNDLEVNAAVLLPKKKRMNTSCVQGHNAGMPCTIHLAHSIGIFAYVKYYLIFLFWSCSGNSYSKTFVDKRERS